MFWIVLLFALGVSIALALMLPIEMRAEGTAGERALGGSVEFRWRGLVRVRMGSELGGAVDVLGLPVIRRPGGFGRAKKTPDEPKEHKASWRPRLGRFFASDLGVSTAMVRRALGALHPRVHVSGTVGLSDPADTATMLAVARLIDRGGPRWFALDIRDDLLEETTQLEGRATIRITLAEVVWIALVWVLRSDTRRVLRA